MNNAPGYSRRVEPFLMATGLMLHAANVGYHRAHDILRMRGRGGACRHPGTDTPMWNILATTLRRAARKPGRMAALARYVGLPRQRLTEYLSSRRRLPDTEVTLRLLHWLDNLKRGRDLLL